MSLAERLSHAIQSGIEFSVLFALIRVLNRVVEGRLRRGVDRWATGPVNHVATETLGLAEDFHNDV
jgi:hypothetical protein